MSFALPNKPNMYLLPTSDHWYVDSIADPGLSEQC